MKVQIIDDVGEICLKTIQQSLLYEKLLEYVKGTVYHSSFARTEDGFRITCEDLLPILDVMAGDIRNLREELRSTPEPAIPRNWLSKVTVLGEVVLLYPVLPSHSLLMELHELYLAFEKAATGGRDLVVYFIPPLTSNQYRLLRVLRESLGGVELSRLEQTIKEEYQRLLGVDVVDEGLRADFEKAMLEFSTNTLLDEDIPFLKKRGLLGEDPGGKKLVATEKLRLVQI